MAALARDGTLAEAPKIELSADAGLPCRRKPEDATLREPVCRGSPLVDRVRACQTSAAQRVRDIGFHQFRCTLCDIACNTFEPKDSADNQSLRTTVRRLLWPSSSVAMSSVFSRSALGLSNSQVHPR